MHPKPFSYHGGGYLTYILPPIPATEAGFLHLVAKRLCALALLAFFFVGFRVVGFSRGERIFGVGFGFRSGVCLPLRPGKTVSRCGVSGVQT